MKTGAGLAAFAASLLSDKALTWYMYGNNGYKITEQFIQTKKLQYPDRYSDAHITELRKHIGSIGYDCSSITDIYTGSDRSANGWLSAATEKGPISTIPELPGLTVHYNGHMGVYVGNGYVVEARGTWYGIVKTRLSDRPWKNWAKVPGVSYEEDIDMIKAGDKSEAVKIWQLALMEAGFSLDPYGADGSFGPLTQRQTDSFKAAAGLPIDSPVTVRYDDWLGMVRYMAGKASTAELEAAQEQIKTLTIKAQENAAYALTIKTQYNKLANAALVIRDAVPMI